MLQIYFGIKVLNVTLCVTIFMLVPLKTFRRFEQGFIQWSLAYLTVNILSTEKTQTLLGDKKEHLMGNALPVYDQRKKCLTQIGLLFLRNTNNLQKFCTVAVTDKWQCCFPKLAPIFSFFEGTPINTSNNFSEKLFLVFVDFHTLYRAMKKLGWPPLWFTPLLYYSR